MIHNRPVIDQWSPLSHKRNISDGVHRFPPTLAPTWVPAHHRRRLDAYMVLASYTHNVARLFLPGGVDSGTGLIDTSQNEHREYGDADLLVDRVMAGVLGDEITLVVDGADEDLPDAPELPDEPEAPAPDANPFQQRAYQLVHARWETEAARALDDWSAAYAGQPALQERQAWLRQWADEEQLNAKLVEGERDTVALGDGVYVLAWSAAKGRPVLDVYDPGFYFPVLDDHTRDFPRKVHLAWEYLDGSGQRFVRRLTWELGPIGVNPDGQPAPELDVPGVTTWPDGAATRVVAGRLVRRYPWNVDENGTPVDSTDTCYFTDATWPFGDLDGRHVDDFDEGRATFATTEDGTVARRLDLRLDFLPVLHVPNTPAHREHFGRSALAIVAQVLDDVAASDTDVQAASALSAGPVVAMSGATALPKGGSVVDARGNSVTAPPMLEVRPGAVYRLGEGGRMDVLDLSAGLAQLLAVNKELLGRLSVNSRVPPEILGRVPSSQAVSGVALALAFGPFQQMVGMLRLTRDPKGALLLKMVQRMAIAGQVLQAPVMAARIEPGSYLPSDRAQLVKTITDLLAAKAISRQTAVALLVDGGLTIDDAQGEVARIRADDPAGAKEAADATGSEQIAADWLGVELPETPRPIVTLPPVPPPPGGST